MSDSDDEDEYDYGAEDEDGSVKKTKSSNRLEKEKVWLDAFIRDKLKKSINKVEAEVDNIRSKKIRGTSKKQKDMLKTLNDKLKLMRATRV